MKDSMTIGITTDGAARIYTAVTTKTVQEAQRLHNLSPVASAALGRALTAASMMGFMLKQGNGKVSLQFKGDGPIGSVFAVGEPDGAVRGYCANPQVDLPPNALGKLDVGGAIGHGSLTVIRDIGVGQPYVGQIPLVTGEIAEDITYYYAQSEQTPSMVALGVLVGVDCCPIAAGGIMIQMMPGFSANDEDTITAFETNMAHLPSVSEMVRQGADADELLSLVTRGLDIDVLMKGEPQYRCNCSMERVERTMAAIGRKELEKLIREDGRASVECSFCDKVYELSGADLEKLLKKSQKD